MDLIILAAGLGKRTKLNYPKQFLYLNEKPILIHILELFRKIQQIDNIIIVMVSDYISKTKEIINRYNIENCICIKGGKTRQESVYNGLKYVITDRVIIHESVRPFINEEFINNLINTNGNIVVPVMSTIPTVFYKDRFLDRNEVLQVQLPQVFNTNILKEAHKKAGIKKYTDDSSLVFGELGIMPVFIDGVEENIKITTSLDIKLAEVIYEEISNNNRW